MNTEKASNWKGEIERHRALILKRLLLASVALGPIAIVAFYCSLPASLGEDRSSYLGEVVPFVAAWLIIVSVLAARGLRHRARGAALVVLVYFLALFVFVRGGLPGSGREWLLLLPALAYVLLGPRPGLITSVLTVATYGVLAVAVGLGWVAPQYAENHGSVSALISEGGSFVLILVAMTVILSSFGSGLQKALAQAGQANAQLAEANEQLTSNESWLRSAAEISRASYSILDPDVLLAESAQHIHSSLAPTGVSRVSLFLVNGAEDSVTLRAASGNGRRPKAPLGQRIALDKQSGVGRCVATGEPLVSAGTAAPGTAGGPVSSPTTTEISLPLRSRGRVLGALCIERGGAASLEQAETAVMQTVADQVAVAIDNARLYEELQRELADRKQAEETLALQAEELARANDELEQFMTIASHHLQEPLRMVASYTRMLERRYKDRLDADAEEFIGYSVRGAVRLQRLINDLTMYSRVTAGGAPFRSVDSADVVQLALADLKTPIDESEAVVTVDELPTIKADARQVKQVFQHLIENAIKFQRDGAPEIHVSAERDQDAWLFSVEDNGLGVEPQYLDRVFLIFQRLHHNDEYTGTGIGLALCKKIVERHGGRIWVESEHGQGSTFRFTIPIRSE